MNTPLNLINFASSKSLIENFETPRIQYYSSSSNQEYEKDESEIPNELNDNKKNKKEENKEIIKENETVKTQADTALLNPEIQNLRIVNVVSMVDLGCQLNLSDIAKSCKNSEYNPVRLNAVIMRIKEPKSVALIFNSGKMVCAGAKNEADSKTAARKFAKTVKKLVNEVIFKNFRIINMVATCDFKFKIHLTKLNSEISYKLRKTLNSKELEKKISYEPQIFPGLIYHMDKPKLAVLVFSSGKVNFVGIKERDDAFEALKNIQPFIQKYKIVIKNKNEEAKEKEFDNI
jgi:transcription initiation factor TFIID TATA-box-binding protein